MRRRFFDADGNPMEWQDYGRGMFIDKETIQRQYRHLLGDKTRKVEIEFKLNGQLLDYDMYPVDKPTIYHYGTRDLG